MAQCMCVTYPDGSRLVEMCCAKSVAEAMHLEREIAFELIRNHKEVWVAYSAEEVASSGPLIVKLAEVVAEWYLGRQLEKRLPPAPVEDDGC